ncbi:Retrovirus-related Pol polyprotein from transposon TNT 1-94 [Cucumis melo var. makuwa]|uniref:Retrovirus-related Pol polyprotein from transposon TNT 1-94 n=1 Tax=Cucumis melo var. makuwa TaxID=1194695 RepID=A0A5A7UN42_CUCMM|nr:Retrovirus-related Pol polyprotein from transposon TNT 1-94 [Cucumis melo var. makuwa]
MVVVVEITMKRKNKGANKIGVDEDEVVEEAIAQIVKMSSVIIVENMNTAQRIAMSRRRWKKMRIFMMIHEGTTPDSGIVLYVGTGASGDTYGDEHFFVDIQDIEDGHVSFDDASKFGHLHYNRLEELAKKYMVHRLPKLSTCEGCALGKKARTMFQKKAKYCAKRPLELIHKNICGPITLMSFSEYTRRTWVYFLKEKSEAFEVFKKLKVMVEKTTNLYIKALRSDRAGEYKSIALTNYCEEEGANNGDGGRAVLDGDIKEKMHKRSEGLRTAHMRQRQQQAINGRRRAVVDLLFPL